MNAALSLPLAGRAAWVTGAASGIGRAVALGFANSGVRVLCLDKDKEGAEQTAHECGSAACVCDLADPDALNAALASIDDAFGAPDMLVNCAGIAERHPATTFPESVWDRIIATNLTAAFRLARHVAPGMIERKRGRIVNLSSIAGSAGYPGTIAYQASKGALEQMTRGLAAEWGPAGVTVNAVAPGAVATPLFDRMLAEDPARAERILARQPISSPVAPEDVAAAVLYLCSDAARMVNGHVLSIDGGYVAT